MATEPMTRLIDALSARTRFGKLMEQAGKKNPRFLVSRRGKPMVISLIMKPDLGLCRLLLSAEIFTEYKAVLSRPKFKKLNAKAVNKFLEHLKKEAS